MMRLSHEKNHAKKKISNDENRNQSACLEKYEINNRYSNYSPYDEYPIISNKRNSKFRESDLRMILEEIKELQSQVSNLKLDSCQEQECTSYCIPKQKMDFLKKEIMSRTLNNRSPINSKKSSIKDKKCFSKKSATKNQGKEMNSGPLDHFQSVCLNNKSANKSKIPTHESIKRSKLNKSTQNIEIAENASQIKSNEENFHNLKIKNLELMNKNLLLEKELLEKKLQAETKEKKQLKKKLKQVQTNLESTLKIREGDKKAFIEDSKFQSTITKIDLPYDKSISFQVRSLRSQMNETSSRMQESNLLKSSQNTILPKDSFVKDNLKCEESERYNTNDLILLNFSSQDQKPLDFPKSKEFLNQRMLKNSKINVKQLQNQFNELLKLSKLQNNPATKQQFRSAMSQIACQIQKLKKQN